MGVKFVLVFDYTIGPYGRYFSFFLGAAAACRPCLLSFGRIRREFSKLLHSNRAHKYSAQRCHTGIRQSGIGRAPEICLDTAG